MDALDYRLQTMEEGMKNLKERLEKLEEAHHNDIDNLREELSEDYNKLTEEFRTLQKEYEVSKMSTDKDLQILRELPSLMESLKATVQEIKTVLEVTKTDLQEVQTTLEREAARGKFDFLLWVRDSVMPALLGFGVLYFILHATGII